MNGPQNDSDIGKGVSVDSNGDVYVVGHSYWSSSSSYDIYLGKFNSSGSNLWNATVSIGDSYGLDVSVESSSGSVYIVGYYGSPSDIYLGKFSVDTINPTAVFTCTPSLVTVGGTVTCTCTPSDVFSGINSSLTLYTPNPSTSQSGTYTTTCTFADIVGNTGVATATYTVNPSGGGVTQNAPTESQSVPTISPTQPAIITINNTEIDLTKITVNVNETVENASLTVSKIDVLPQGDLKVGLPTGTSYQIFQITTTGMNDTNIANVTVDFKVNKTWLTEQNGTIGDIALYRKQDLGNQWDVLSTTYTSEDSQYYYFSALSPGFSTFLVFFGKYECEVGSRRCFNDQVQLCVGNSTWLITKKCNYGCKEGECVGTFSISTVLYISIIVIVSVGILITLYLGLRRLFKKRNEVKS